jgi:SET and MYND domain-containing protein
LCITYLDPALLQSKHQILELSYGFTCSCPSCQFIKRIGTLPELPTDSGELSALGRELRDFVGIDFQRGSSLPIRPIESTPPVLYPVLRQEYLTSLSSTFSESSHQGQYTLAIDSGIKLLSLYVLIYPSNYPQIGEYIYIKLNFSQL